MDELKEYYLYYNPDFVKIGCEWFITEEPLNKEISEGALVQEGKHYYNEWALITQNKLVYFKKFVEYVRKFHSGYGYNSSQDIKHLWYQFIMRK